MYVYTRIANNKMYGAPPSSDICAISLGSEVSRANSIFVRASMVSIQCSLRGRIYLDYLHMNTHVCTRICRIEQRSLMSQIGKLGPTKVAGYVSASYVVESVLHRLRSVRHSYQIRQSPREISLTLSNEHT